MNYRKRKKHGEKMKFGGIHDHIHYRWNGTHLADIKGFFENPDLVAEIYIYANEGGHEPHFHLMCEKINFHAVILINKAGYYHHLKHQDILNDNQKKMLIDVLKSYHERTRNYTIWELIIKSWRSDFYSYKPANFEMPDYMNLGEKIEDFQKLKKRPANWRRGRDMFYIHPGYARIKNKWIQK